MFKLFLKKISTVLTNSSSLKKFLIFSSSITLLHQPKSSLFKFFNNVGNIDELVKILSLKALWQVTEIKKAGAAPVIFIDEPTLSQLGASSYITISHEEVIAMLREISDIIKNNGGISGIHCCGKCSWTVPIDAGIDIISLDAYTYAQNLSIYHKEIKTFLEKGGKIAWGIVPTKDKKALENADLTIIDDKFKKAVNYLTKKGINEKLIIENSLVTPTCGAGSLSNELAEKAMRLTFELKERYNDN